MFSKKNNKGFTLMEMLIVVAIIAILIAIMIPTFNAQLEKAREAADAANIRSAYAEVMVAYLDPDSTLPTGVTKDKTTSALSKKVDLQQAQDDWQTTTLEDNIGKLGTVTESEKPSKGGTCTVTVATTGAVTISYAGADN